MDRIPENQTIGSFVYCMKLIPLRPADSIDGLHVLPRVAGRGEECQTLGFEESQREDTGCPCQPKSPGEDLDAWLWGVSRGTKDSCIHEKHKCSIRIELWFLPWSMIITAFHPDSTGEVWLLLMMQVLTW